MKKLEEVFELAEKGRGPVQGLMQKVNYVESSIFGNLIQLGYFGHEKTEVREASSFHSNSSKRCTIKEHMRGISREKTTIQ